MDPNEAESAVRIRAANPSLEDGLAFARLVDVSAEGFFGFMLGRNAAQILANAFIEPDHDLSYQYVTYLEHDGVIVGMWSGYTAEQHRRSSHEPLKQAAGGKHLRMRLVLMMFAPLMRIIDSIHERDFYLGHIAVDSAVQGRGVGSALMDSFEEAARERGSERMALDVSARNAQARTFYERRGWIIESQWPKRFPLPALKFYRMTKEL